MKKYLAIIALIGLVVGFVIGWTLFVEQTIESEQPKTDAFIPRAEIVPEQPKVTEIEGIASYYNRGICELHGTVYGEDCLTASGDIFDDQAMTAACPKNLLGKKIKVLHSSTEIIVSCTDTGSFGEKYGRVLDLSQGAFEKLAPSSKGVIQISYVEVAQ